MANLMNMCAGASNNLSKYKILDYLQSTGTQWINLTDTSITKNTRIDLKFYISVATGAWYGIIGNDITGTNDSGLHINTNKNTGNCVASIFGNKAEFAHGAVTEVRLNDNGKVYVDNVEKVSAGAGALSSANLALFTVNGSGGSQYTIGNTQIYYCKVYENGTLVRELIPCVSNSNEIGMYDKVNNKFYVNSGTGTFTKGTETGEIIYG